MNTQDIIMPIGKLLEWSFETILVPMADPLNIGVVVLCTLGSIYWLRLQKKYTEKAEKDGTIM